MKKKRCRSGHWMTVRMYDLVIDCERPSGHRGLHRGHYGNGADIKAISWDVGGPPKEAMVTKPDPREPFTVEGLIRELRLEARIRYLTAGHYHVCAPVLLRGPRVTPDQVARSKHISKARRATIDKQVATILRKTP